MKRTQKFLAAQSTLSKLGTSVAGYENDEMYSLLEKQNYFWNSKSQAWEKKEIKPSIFDNPSDGFVGLRVMAHPEVAQKAILALQDHFPASIIQESNEYPNREDVGTRVYLLLKFGGHDG